MPNPTNMCSVGGTPKATKIARCRKHSRSKNGCVTCKNKHKKCDEKKPKCSNCITRSYDCSFSTNMAAASVNSDNHQFSTISEVRSFSGIRECSTSAIARQEQREQIPIFNIQSTPGEMQNHELTRKHKTPGSPVDQPSKKRRTETYEVPKSPCQTSYAQESILEAFAQTTQPRSEQRLNDALEKRLKGISEELKRVSETQKKIESQISVDWPDLESRIHQQVRAEMTNVVLEARSTRRKAVSELRQELEKGSVLQNVPEFLRELNVEAKGSEHLPPKNRSAEYSITGSG